MDHVDRILQEWRLQNELGDIFKRNQIDEETFNSLTDDDIKELIPIIGVRKKFLLQYNVYMKLIKETNESKSSDDTTITILSTSDVEIENLSPEEPHVLYKIPNENVHTAFCGLENISEALGNNFPEVNLKYILETSALGKNVLNFYKENDYLDNGRRTILVDILIKYLYNYIAQHRLRHEQYQLLAQKVVDLFPHESTLTYYIPYVPKRNSSTGTGILAKGRLVDKVRNILYLSGDTVKYKKRRSAESEDVTYCNDNDDVMEAVLFLKHFDKPWDEIIKKWKETANHRRQCKVTTVHEFFKEWPLLLRNPDRIEELINLDFEYLFGTCKLNLLQSWGQFYEKVLTVSDISKVKDRQTLEEYLLILGDETSSDDLKHLSQLQVLCHLIPPKGRIRVNKKDIWKFTIAECIESIFIQVPSAGDVESAIDEQRTKALNQKQALQPFLLIVGNIDQIQSIFIVIDTVRYQCNSFLKALDTLFKLFHVFNAKYPVQSEHFWTLIQNCIFKINTNLDQKFPNLMHIFKLFESN